MSYVYKKRYKTIEGCSRAVASHNRYETQRPVRRCYFFMMRLILCPDQRWRRDILEWDELTQKAGRYRWCVRRETKAEKEREEARTMAAKALGVID